MIETLINEFDGQTGPIDQQRAEGPTGDERALVQSAVRALPVEQRQAIELAFYGGLTHTEIASELNEPLGTVKARIRRGMLKLRDSLKSYV